MAHRGFHVEHQLEIAMDKEKTLSKARALHILRTAQPLTPEIQAECAKALVKKRAA